MLKKKIASVLTAAIRNCPKCGKQVSLSATIKETVCPKCQTIVEKEDESDDNTKK